MKLSDVGDLPATLDTATAADLLGVGIDSLWKMAREGTAPVKPLKLGRSYRWPTAPLLALLGLSWPSVTSHTTVLPGLVDAAQIAYDIAESRRGRNDEGTIE